MTPHQIARRLSACAFAVAALPASPSASAWTDHALATRQALAALPAAADAAPVTAEPLHAFVRADAARLEQVLAAEEAWAREHVPEYAPRPDALALQAAQAGDAVARFLAALRVHPATPLPLFVQVMPGTRTAAAPLPWTAVTLLRAETTMPQLQFASLREGEPVPVLDVIASASDEPDHGLDINVWEDNGTAWGRAYGFGRQPFGNPRAENSTQAPFHMGFFHEAAIVYRLAGFLKRTYPEFRIHLYRGLAVEAFRSGHAYWGWRFTGWALHHVQDLTQPYHSQALPGVGVASMLWANALDHVGVHGAKNDAVQLVTNRHFALENFQFHALKADYEAAHFDSPTMAALRDRSGDAALGPWRDSAVREDVGRAAAAASTATDALLAASLPARYVSDPTFVFTEAGGKAPDLDALLRAQSPAQRAALEQGVAPLMRAFGAESRRFVASVLAEAGRPAAAARP
ncbi:MAG: hypothetical protein JO090_02160 [Rhizobacter sp.]|nr:hypothetical protein [Rhizobacter sp.]